MRVKVDGLYLNYELTGMGEFMTLIHGLGDNLGMWVNQVRYFAQHYRVLAYDVRGFGQSDKPPGEYSVEVFADDLYHLLTALNIEKTILVGFSMGGVIAMRFALDYPAMISGLVIASSSSEVNKKNAERFREWIANVEKNGFAKFADTYVEGRFHPGFVKNNPEFIAKWKKQWLENDLHGWIQAASAMTRYNYTTELDKITSPTLIIVGDKDMSVGVGGSVIISRRIPSSRLVILPDIGHGITREKPELFNSALEEFFASTSL